MDMRSKWIWADTPSAIDQYAEFADTFSCEKGDLTLCISADSNYAVYVNGTFAASGQYPDFPHYKVYDKIDLAPFAKCGENRLCIVVWYYGKGNMGYFPGNAALRYSLKQGENLLCASGENTLSRISRAYVNGLDKTITGQLGMSFFYDAAKEDGWLTSGADGFVPSRVVGQDLPMHLRPQKRCTVGEEAPSVCIKSENGTHFLYDLLQESAGYLSVDIESDTEQEILIAYGEHIVDGGVRRIIASRDFSVQIGLKKGRTTYVNPFRRLGLRYLEVFAAHPVKIHRMTILPVDYPLSQKAAPAGMDSLQKKIYDTCIRTLRMCMHDHYEDTPWREQALYAMDSRNQILCGYYAFGEYEFPRANLLLMSKDEREDGLLSICTPSSNDLTIPSFSLHYFTEIWEYTAYSGDLSLAKEVFPKLRRLIAAFTGYMDGGLIPVFTQPCHWNFYEWSEGLSGKLHQAEGKRFDTALNCLLAIALRAMGNIARAIGEEDSYSALAESIAKAVRVRFFDENTGLFINSTEDKNASELVNALAVLCTAAQGEEAQRIANRLAQADNGLTGATLSMLCFKYDALLLADKEKYRNYVLSDISVRYEKMLAAGATTFWETEEGERDFGNAGSLCHGWSAMPVYYYHTLLEDACASKN